MKSYYLKIKKRYLKIIDNEKFKNARNNFLIILLILGMTIWVFLMMIQLGLTKYEFLKDLALISLTLFGITLLGGIFDKKSPDDEPKVYKEMFYSSILFLLSFIFLLICYNLGTIYLNYKGKTLLDILIFMTLFSLILFIIAIISTSQVLFKHYIDKYSKEVKNEK